jgi:hypothetical protein
MSATHHRRDFVRGLGLGAAAGLLTPPDLARADDPKPKDDAKPEPSQTEADGRMQLVLARFGKQLDDDARKAVRQEIDGIVSRAERLRKFELTNGDGPFFVFAAYRGPLT